MQGILSLSAWLPSDELRYIDSIRRGFLINMVWSASLEATELTNRKISTN